MAMYYDRFIPEWIRRSERDGVHVDDGDRFISLWIAFNGWLKKEYGENKGDLTLLNEAKGKSDLGNIFCWLKENDQQFENDLKELSIYRVINMKFETDRTKDKKYNGDFESFIDVIYQIRCNLFHGRKNFDENEIDKKLITLALKLLGLLFKKFAIKHYIIQQN